MGVIRLNQKGGAAILFAVGVATLAGTLGFYAQMRASNSVKDAVVTANQLEGFYSSEIAAWQHMTSGSLVPGATSQTSASNGGTYVVVDAKTAPVQTKTTVRLGNDDSESNGGREATVISNDVTVGACPGGKCSVPKDGFIPLADRKVGVPSSLVEVIATRPDLLAVSKRLTRRWEAGTVVHETQRNPTGEVHCGVSQFGNLNRGARACLATAATPTPLPPTPPPPGPCAPVNLDEPWNIRIWVNDMGGTNLREQNVLYYDEDTARAACAAMRAPILLDYGPRSTDGRTGWTSPGDNFLSRYDTATSAWVTRPANDLGNRWLGSIRCGCAPEPTTPPRPRQLCRLPTNHRITVLHSGYDRKVPRGTYSGSSNFTLPGDATNISIAANRIHVDDNSPIINLNGTEIYRRLEGQSQKAHDITVNLPLPLRAGVNEFSGTTYNRVNPSWWAIYLYVNGTYEAETCTQTCAPGVDGVAVGGSCWVLGKVGQSCTSACTDKGLGYDNATNTFAGARGSQANCTAVMTALKGNIGSGALGPLTNPTNDNQYKVGCVTINAPMAWWYTGADTHPDANWLGPPGPFQRACACR